MRIRKSISNKIQSFSESIAKETVYRIVMFAGIALTGYGIYLQDIAIIISGSALITASVIGIVMSMQTNKIAHTIYERFDRQDKLADMRHKETISVLKEMMSVLKEIVTLLKDSKECNERMSQTLDRIDKNTSKLDRIDKNTSKLDRIDKNTSKLDRIDKNTSKLDRIDKNTSKLDRIDKNTSKLDRIDKNTSKLAEKL